MSSPGTAVGVVAVSVPEAGLERSGTTGSGSEAARVAGVTSGGLGARNEDDDCARVGGRLSPTAGIGVVCGEGVGATAASVEATDVASKNASSDESPGRSGAAGVMAVASVRAGEEGEEVGEDDGASGAKGFAASAGGASADAACTTSTVDIGSRGMTRNSR